MSNIILNSIYICTPKYKAAKNLTRCVVVVFATLGAGFDIRAAPQLSGGGRCTSEILGAPTNVSSTPSCSFPLHHIEGPSPTPIVESGASLVSAEEDGFNGTSDVQYIYRLGYGDIGLSVSVQTSITGSSSGVASASAYAGVSFIDNIYVSGGSLEIGTPIVLDYLFTIDVNSSAQIATQDPFDVGNLVFGSFDTANRFRGSINLSGSEIGCVSLGLNPRDGCVLTDGFHTFAGQTAAKVGDILVINASLEASIGGAVQTVSSSSPTFASLSGSYNAINSLHVYLEPSELFPEVTLISESLHDYSPSIPVPELGNFSLMALGLGFLYMLLMARRQM